MSSSDENKHDANPFSWIQEGMTVNVADGTKGREYTAKVLSKPVFDSNGWRVKIKWEVAGGETIVECWRCSQIQLNNGRAKRLRKSKSIFTPMHIPRKKSKLNTKIMKREPAKKSSVTAVEGPPEVIDLTQGSEECQSLTSCSIASPSSTEMESLFGPNHSTKNGQQSNVARMPPPDEEDTLFGGIYATPSPPPPPPPPPAKKHPESRFATPKRSGATRKCSMTDESSRDDGAELNKKPAARGSFKPKFELAKQVLANLSLSADQIKARLKGIHQKFARLDTATLEKQRRNGKSGSRFQVEIGMTFIKHFDDKPYEGIVLFKGKAKRSKDEKIVNVWKVVYEDEEMEDLEYHELLDYRQPSAEMSIDGDSGASTPNSTRTRNSDYRQPSAETSMDGDSCASMCTSTLNSEERRKQFEAAKEALISHSFSPQEAEAALKKIGPPFDRLNTAAFEIQRKRKDDGRFEVEIGMSIRKAFHGKEYDGVVLNKVEGKVKNKNDELVDAWEVGYFEDRDCEELDYNDLLRWRYPRPEPSKVRGRQMQALELFCGRAIVTQEFRQRGWKVAAVDNDKNSNATIFKDILDIEPHDLPFVPDFIWASLPCHTYSNLGAGKHRNAKKGEFEKTEEARLNNFFLAKMVKIMKWARGLHHHLIIVIENPVGQLKNMPLMQDFVEEFELQAVKVEYCAFGRHDNKPTYIWSNKSDLCSTLEYFTCAKRCCVGGRGNHEMIQDNGHLRDYGAIPEALAEEVAEYVHSKFNLKRIRRRKAADPKQGQHDDEVTL